MLTGWASSYPGHKVGFPHLPQEATASLLPEEAAEMGSPSLVSPPKRGQFIITEGKQGPALGVRQDPMTNIYEPQLTLSQAI